MSHLSSLSLIHFDFSKQCAPSNIHFFKTKYMIMQIGNNYQSREAYHPGACRRKNIASVLNVGNDQNSVDINY